MEAAKSSDGPTTTSWAINILGGGAASPQKLFAYIFVSREILAQDRSSLDEGR